MDHLHVPLEAGERFRAALAMAVARAPGIAHGAMERMHFRGIELRSRHRFDASDRPIAGRAVERARRRRLVMKAGLRDMTVATPMSLFSRMIRPPAALIAARAEAFDAPDL
jgi:hypothetical protein